MLPSFAAPTTLGFIISFGAYSPMEICILLNLQGDVLIVSEQFLYFGF